MIVPFVIELFILRNYQRIIKTLILQGKKGGESVHDFIVSLSSLSFWNNSFPFLVRPILERIELLKHLNLNLQKDISYAHTIASKGK